jgi:hypothetical protein
VRLPILQFRRKKKKIVEDDGYATRKIIIITAPAQTSTSSSPSPWTGFAPVMCSISRGFPSSPMQASPHGPYNNTNEGNTQKKKWKFGK